jgi:hypothetical protein
VSAQSDFSPFLDILTDELDQLYWEGIEVKERSRVPFICRAMLLSIITDYRGMPELFRLAQSPAFVGACYKCEQVGSRMAEGSAKTIYPGDHKLDALTESAAQLAVGCGCWPWIVTVG